MQKVKLIIEIPKSDYKAICANKEDAIIAHDTCRRIANNGIPLDENKGEWIPVTERLPETTEYVLATDGLDMFVAWYSPEKARFKGWYRYENISVKNPILAWQPLPEPYKAESEVKPNE